MATEPLFRDDPYRSSCEATVVGVNERGGILLDRTVFYAAGGGQPGDSGVLRFGGDRIEIATTVKGDGPGDIVHVPVALDVSAEAGRAVEAELDWQRRYRMMRLHTCLHLLSVAVPHPVTGGQIAEEYGRLDFDVADARLDKDELSEKLNALISGDHRVSVEWITDEELADNPGLVKTMKVKPPKGSGKVRLVRIGDVDLQPCGGTHVRSTAEIGRVVVTKIESKGAQNRRVRVAFADN